jgi:hypothetical protein
MYFVLGTSLTDIWGIWLVAIGVVPRDGQLHSDFIVNFSETNCVLIYFISPPAMLVRQHKAWHWRDGVFLYFEVHLLFVSPLPPS